MLELLTQNKVEKKIEEGGEDSIWSRKEKFIEEVWKCKEEYGNIILNQFKKIGCSCDWSRARFTLDEDYSKAVKEAFKHYYEKNISIKGRE